MEMSFDPSLITKASCDNCSSDCDDSSECTSSPPSPVVVVRRESTQHTKASPKTCESTPNKYGRKGRPLTLENDEFSWTSTRDTGIVRTAKLGDRKMGKVVKKMMNLKRVEAGRSTRKEQERLMEKHSQFKDELKEQKSNPLLHRHLKAFCHGKYHKISGLWHINPKHTRHQFHACRHCKTGRTNRYCTCAVCSWMCYPCYCNHIVSESKKKDPDQTCDDANNHRLIAAPPHARCFDKSNKGWNTSNKDQWQKYNCRMCGKKRCRIYCVCNPGYWVCRECHPRHVQAVCTNGNLTI